jgi:hypothetical protein
VPGRAPGGLPHSEIPGSQAASASPGHFAAWPRPSSAANAKASTMRPSCGFLHLCPSSVCRYHAIRPARASGTSPVWHRACPACRTLPVLYLCDVSMQCARATHHEPRPRPRLGATRISGRARSPKGPRRLPRPQNPAGSAWRIVKVPGGLHALHKRASRPREGDNPRPKSYADLGRSLPSSAVPGPRVMLPWPSRPGAVPGWSRGDSNPGPPPCKGGALPAKLRPPAPRCRPGRRPRPPGGVGAPGLEPGTSALSGPRSNHLSYAPAGRSPGRRRAGSSRGSPGVLRMSPARTPARCPRRSARTAPAPSCLPSRPRVAPPTSPSALAPLPGPATVWRRENLGARCPARPDLHPAA